MITQQKLKEILRYNENTGIFTRKVTRGNSISGSMPGYVNERGYLMINICSKNYRAHRLAWLYVHGRFPNDQIDHINRDKVDNRIINLRDVTSLVNNNNRAMRKSSNGLYWRERDRKWEIAMTINGNRAYIGGSQKSKKKAMLIRITAENIFGKNENVNQLLERFPECTPKAQS